MVVRTGVTALAGAATIGAAYAAARRAGLTRVDLASRLAPQRPAAGRALQLAAGSLACLPAAHAAGALRGAALGSLAGIAVAGTHAATRERLLAVAAHAAGGLVAGALAGAQRPSSSPAPSGSGVSAGNRCATSGGPSASS